MEITDEKMVQLQFRRFRKSALTRARLLTENDYNQRKGVIQALEGPVTFQPGDYLAQGVKKEEWPITGKHFEDTNKKVAPADADGFALYVAQDIREACQMQKDFSVKSTNGDILNGKKGDYLVRSGGNAWVVEREIFESTYELAEDTSS